MKNRAATEILKFICHSYAVSSLALDCGWLPGARYTNLRDVRRFERVYFVDIDWNNYNYLKHLQVVKDTRPMMTVARDIVNLNDLDLILEEALELSNWADKVIVVPKDVRLMPMLPNAIPDNFVLGYSIPTNYGNTALDPTCFAGREVHLLGGHPAKQRALANQLKVISLDCNRFTLDAAFGDFFDGETFRPHPLGGYDLCIRESLLNINHLWEGYKPR